MEALFQQLKALKELTDELKAHQKPYLSLDEASEYLSLSKSCLYKKTSNREIPFYCPGGKLIYFHREDLNKWIESNRINSFQEDLDVVEHQLYGEKGGKS